MALSIIMYHYVRDLARSRYPAIKGLTVDGFRAQLDALGRRGTFVRVEEVVAARRGGPPLPDDAVLLTFDDGYADHYATVFPILHARGIQGAFFPPVRAVRDRVLLDVNKVHFALASAPDADELVRTVLEAMRAARDEFGLDAVEDYWSRYAKAYMRDPPEVVFVKRMLQHALPEPLRRRIADDLFRRYVGVDETVFANELYLSEDQARTMIRCGMYVGGHGDRHGWMDRLPPAEQRREVERSLEFLAGLGAPTEDWVMCYPYGACNDSLVRIVAELGCAVAMISTGGSADPARLAGGDWLRLPRVDTNDVAAQLPAG